MDNWQKHVFDKCSAFVSEEFAYVENEVTISLNQRETYIVMKALEDQQKYLNPTIQVEAKNMINTALEKLDG
jgi:hypothetical protein